MSPSELDECNGRTTTNEQGEKEYHYVWSVSDPFLPPCFKLQPAPLKANKTNGDICLQSGENLQHTASPKGEYFWVLRSHGCPDHPYFGEPVKVGAVASVLDRAAAIRKLEVCSASSGEGSVAFAVAQADALMQIHHGRMHPWGEMCFCPWAGASTPTA